MKIASKGTWHAPEPSAAMAATALPAHRAFAPAAAPMASSAGSTPAALAPVRPAALLARRAWLPSTTPSRRALLCRAADGEGKQQQQSAAGASQPSSGGAGGSSQEQPKRPAVEDPSIAKGQRTAIITGAISIIFGVRCGGAECRAQPSLLLGLSVLLACRPMMLGSKSGMVALRSSSIVCMHYCSAAHACSIRCCNAPDPVVELDKLPSSAVCCSATPQQLLSPPQLNQQCCSHPAVYSSCCTPMQVIYLALVSFLDMRGGELLPPPPEAYLP